MSSLNKIMILGRLGKKPELLQSKSGKPYCKLTIATEVTLKRENGDFSKKTSWHWVHVFGKNAIHCTQYLDKGRQVFIEGRLDQVRNQNQSEGGALFSTFILGERVSFLNPPTTFQEGDEQSSPSNPLQ